MLDYQYLAPSRAYQLTTEASRRDIILWHTDMGLPSQPSPLGASANVLQAVFAAGRYELPTLCFKSMLVLEAVTACSTGFRKRPFAQSLGRSGFLLA